MRRVLNNRTTNHEEKLESRPPPEHRGDEQKHFGRCEEKRFLFLKEAVRRDALRVWRFRRDAARQTRRAASLRRDALLLGVVF